MTIKKLQPVGSELGLWLLLYCALYDGSKMALNILLFVSPIFALSYLVTYFSAVVSEKKKETPNASEITLARYRNGKHLPLWTNVVFYTITVLLLAAFAHCVGQ